MCPLCAFLDTAKLLAEGRARADAGPRLQSALEGMSRGWVGWGLVEGYSKFADAGISRDYTAEKCLRHDLLLFVD